MLEAIETLIALANHGTMSKAAVALRITQSAVSKRISNLEAQYGQPVIEKVGRRVRITENGQHLIHKVSPLLREMNELIKAPIELAPLSLRIGVSESILSSWGAPLLKKVSDEASMTLNVLTHRSPVIVEKLLAGEIDIGVCAGFITNTSGHYVSDKVFDEEMVVITSHPKQNYRPRDLIVIEDRSATWPAIQSVFIKKGLQSPVRVQSFFAIAQMALAGMGDGLVPLGVAEALKIPSKRIHRWRGRPMTRPIHLIYKKHRADSKEYREILGRLAKGSKA